MSLDYNKTLNLPSTEFPMRASLPEKEPGYLSDWENKRLYYQMIDRNKGKPSYILHDGPPYANGNIHIGTATNKIIKDFITRYKNMSGFCSPYVPGWDMHGLPTERMALMKLGVSQEQLSRTEIRKVCRDYAAGFVETMTEQFKRLGVLGDWEHPYRTVAKNYEATQIKVFGEMARKGYIYKGLKSVYWCPECVTALAEAEIEYADDPVESIYVRFGVTKDNGTFADLGVPLDKTYFVIWTTTTWTIPANVAVALHPEHEYDIVKAGDEYYVVASALRDEVMGAAGIGDYVVAATREGRDFEGIWVRHPYLERESMVVNGEYVTLESGTGAVHIAPGHGVEDFELVAEKYPQLPVIVPVDDKGIMKSEAGFVEGLTTEQASEVIRDLLIGTGHIIATKKMVHQYPHCWRCKKPILFRATEQWFCSVEDFKAQTVDAIDKVRWTPSWGRDRIAGMVSDRKDWCISRQRSWGLPIPVFYCLECGEYHISEASINAVSELFRREGSDAWYIKDAAEILPPDVKCEHCGSGTFYKETDIMDVWFDSGSSHLAVLEDHPELKWPFDLYLEGSDQYRGWFQSSLLTAVALKGEAPYRNVFSHGWVVDGDGKKQSKSLGNYIEPAQVTGKYGADILRLWVASVDYQTDMRISEDILKQLSEAYRKIRNTARFILGNLKDFEPGRNSASKLEELDNWALYRLQALVDSCHAAYEANEFHTVYRLIHNFCVVDMSNFYLDVAKSRLYVERADSDTRRAAQYVMYTVLTTLTLLISPILVFTSEEIWSYLPQSPEYNYESVVFNEIPKSLGSSLGAEEYGKWNRILALRDEVKKALETARSEKLIGAPLDAGVTVYASKDFSAFLRSAERLLPETFIVSEVTLSEDSALAGDEVRIEVTKASGKKCERCWSYSVTVGDDAEHPALCSKCIAILR